jgi:hypothetical protein
VALFPSNYISILFGKCCVFLSFQAWFFPWDREKYVNCLYLRYETFKKSIHYLEPLPFRSYFEIWQLIHFLSTDGGSHLSTCIAKVKSTYKNKNLKS